MTARIDTFRHSLAIVGAMLFTAALVVYSTPVLPIA